MATDSTQLPVRLIYRKSFPPDDPELARVLTVYDLTFLGVGSGLSLAMYGLPGQLARNMAGPAVGICLAVAGLLSLSTALCYAEFASRVPRAGGAYVFSYVTMGELVAFTVGWCLVLQYMISAALISRHVSMALDVIVDYKISTALTNLLELNCMCISKYIDILALAFIAVAVGLLTLGVKEYARVNLVLTAISLLGIVVAIGVAYSKVNFHNWAHDKDTLPVSGDGGAGGFFPFGLLGVVDASSFGYFAFVGFDVIASAGAEAINPSRNISLAILLSVITLFSLYIVIATAITLMVPYYNIPAVLPWVYVFAYNGMATMRWFAAVGSLLAALTSLLGTLLPIPRVIYALSRDGIMLSFLGRLTKKTKSPVVATLILGFLTAGCAAFLDISLLVHVGSITVMLPHAVVSTSVILQHYKTDERRMSEDLEATPGRVLYQIFNLAREKQSNQFTECIARVSLCIFMALNLTVGVIIKCFGMRNSGAMMLVTIITPFIIFTMLVIGLQPKSDELPPFRVPLVPLIPCLSISVNICMVFHILVFAWWVLALWMLIGYFIYFGILVVEFFDDSRLIERAERLNLQAAGNVIAV